METEYFDPTVYLNFYAMSRRPYERSPILLPPTIISAQQTMVEVGPAREQAGRCMGR